MPRPHKLRAWEAMLWLSILETRSLNVAVCDTITTVPQTNGIRQGSQDSPDLFGAIIARDLQKAIQARNGPTGPTTTTTPGGCFLDDTYLWSQSRDHLQAVIRSLETELAEDGLHIHPTKTFLFSKPTGGGTFTSGGETVACEPHNTVIAALGSPITFAEQTTAIIAEMMRRGRIAFGKHKKILLARTHLHSRLLACTTLVRNAALYAAETWPAHQCILRAANSLQAQHIREMLFLNRRPGEQWAAWQTRTLRLARLHLHRHHIERWSSYTLKRIWSLWGHMARGGAEVNSMVGWKNMQFWRAQQELPRKHRVTHASRFNPEADVERAIEAVAGTNWGAVAQDRPRWQQLAAAFVEKFDVPWATGKQLSLQDNLGPTSPSCSHSRMKGRPTAAMRHDGEPDTL